MASRHETSQQKRALTQRLRDNCRAGRYTPGVPMPSLRELAGEYGLSKDVISQSLRELVEEGLLYTVPRVGVFVGRPEEHTREFYLMLLPSELGFSQEFQLRRMQNGFEERIAERGGACLSMPLHAALGAHERGELPPLAGLFDLSYHPGDEAVWPHATGVPVVAFSGRVPIGVACDEVDYDSEGGGALATRHLLQVGHRRIAFLGLHGRSEAPGELIWSQQRALGWKRALEAAGEVADALLLPDHEPAEWRDGTDALMRAAGEAAQQLCQFPDVTAVVAANDHAAQALFAHLHATGVPEHCWPATVGFDDLPGLNGHLLTSLRLPGENLGAVAADLLWERRHGELCGAPVHRTVSMRLIPRLTSRTNWTASGRTTLVAPLAF